ncbi:conserved hypothetical protein [Crocosphaera subtropica ATCC 51142]|uniref:Uncharacterized protein n=1 Tax=Crocosphaera subtropica (strain ATCC 51142 / BH68) TaxID=43989 RepID=B1WZX5_CROS5|nr:hypothetical protein [Crocosphaera subtropica]ACB52874.1 conserved hypothetical protein [Crocosphaera subtropica ATCC 51142]
MDSSNHQPYKSKLFNFVNRQSLRWRDRLIRSVQYLRVGTEWSLQILIYPIYLMVQAGRATRKQLRLGFTQKALPINKNNTVSSTPKVDRPLTRVFQETEHCLTQSKTQKKTKNETQTSPVMIQGVASEMDSHDLVLVAENNTIIDILSETQQKHLKKYIRLETANYWYDFKQQKKENLGLISIFSPEEDHVLPPIRWFWQVMRWMQTGTLAMTLDFFGESSLVPVIPQNTITTLSKKSQFSEQENSIKSLQLSASVHQKLQQWREHIKQKSNESLNIDNENPFRLEFLIYAAIDYFFNRVIPPQPLTSGSQQNTLQSSSEKIDHPWLSWRDLYEENPSVHIPATVSSSSPFLYQGNFSHYQAKKSFKKREKRNKKSLIQSSTKLQKTNNLQQSNRSDFLQSNHQIDKSLSHWVDTEAKSSGYVKHPLVRVLEWLDSAIHWLEEIVNNLSRFLRKRR